MQLVDELSMIYTTCLMCYVTFSFGKTSTYRSILASSLIGLSLFITLYYHVSVLEISEENEFLGCTLRSLLGALSSLCGVYDWGSVKVHTDTVPIVPTRPRLPSNRLRHPNSRGILPSCIRYGDAAST